MLLETEDWVWGEAWDSGSSSGAVVLKQSRG